MKQPIKNKRDELNEPSPTMGTKHKMQPNHKANVTDTNVQVYGTGKQAKKFEWMCSQFPFHVISITAFVVGILFVC